MAAHQLGKCWRDGLGVLPDDDKAELWFCRSAEAHSPVRVDVQDFFLLIQFIDHLLVLECDLVQPNPLRLTDDHILDRLEPYQEVRDTAQEAMRNLIREMKSGICDCPVIEDKLFTLSEMLQDVKGKKVYGYLTKQVKAPPPPAPSGEPGGASASSQRSRTPAGQHPPA